MRQSYVVLGSYAGVCEPLCRRLVERGALVPRAGRDAQRLAQLRRLAAAQVRARDDRPGTEQRAGHHEAIAAAKAGIAALALAAAAS